MANICKGSQDMSTKQPTKTRKRKQPPKAKRKTQRPLKLNIGGGAVKMDGFTTIDRRNGQEAHPLPYDDGSVDEIYASHILEHFDNGESLKVMDEWARVLKIGGRMRIAVPDFAFIANQYVHANGKQRELSSLLFSYAMGGQTDENDYHKSAWDEDRLDNLMQAVGLQDIHRFESTVEDCSRLQVSLNLEGTKVEKLQIPRPRITAIMSTSRLAFTENLFCAMHVFAPRQIELIKHTGAFWGQCLERVMTEAIEREDETKRPEWILTMDYDTVFNEQQFERLCYELATHPEADAIAPWQCKRESNLPLCWFIDDDGNHRSEIPITEFDKDVIQVRDAHFGLTLIRAKALEKMKHPWFEAKPNKDGRWEEGRLDDDIRFWRQWQDVGNTLYLANRVSIGHLQQMVTWVRKDNRRPVHQYLCDFQKEGPPQEAAR